MPGAAPDASSVSTIDGGELPRAAEDVYVALFEDDAETRAAAHARLAAQAWSGMVHDAVVMGLMGGLSGGRTVRARAIDALAALGEHAVGAADALLDVAATDPSLTARMSAAAARTRVLPGEPLDATPFALALVLGEREERHDAIARLADLGAAAWPAVAPLLKVLEHADVTARQQAMLALSRIGVEALAQALDSPSALARRHAVLLLDRRQGELSRAVPLLVRALRDRDAAVRRSAAVSLGRCGAWARCAIPALLHALRDPDAEVGWWSALAAVTLGLASPDVIAALADAADRAPVDLRQRAAGALARIGWAARRAA